MQTYESRAKWKPRPLMYKGTSMIKFLSEKDLASVIHEFWKKNSRLFQMPRNHFGDKKILIPSVALSYFKNYNFAHQRVARREDAIKYARKQNE